MIAKLTSVCVAMVLVSMVTAQTAGTGGTQAGMSPCQQQFLTSLYKCIGDNGLEVTNFLWMVTNQTSGAAPANAETFKKTACGKQQDLGNCIITFMNILINASICQPTAQTPQTQDPRRLIEGQFMSLARAYDETCAHPCRKTLFVDLRACYTEAHLDPDLFLSNATMSRGAVIGTTNDEAETFCKNKEDLIKCMKSRRDDCPESPRMLSMIGLDIDSMEQGVEVLCKHTDLYIIGVECFAEQTKAIEGCMRKQAQDTMQLMIDTRDKNLTEEVVGKRFCEIRLDHVDCDLGGWREKNHKACTPSVIGLRTELECGLLPDPCKVQFADAIEDICHIDNFGYEGRPGGAVVAGISLSMVSIPILLVLAAILDI